jgi:DNA-binding MarR family transcriptional regulator
VRPAEIDLPTLVALAGPAVVELLVQRTAAAGYAGVRPSHGYVMQRLVEDEPTITELAASLGMSQQGASKQVADLEQRGWVHRVPRDGDLRVRAVRLTPAGRGLLEAGRRERELLAAELTARVGADCVEQAQEALAALLDLVGLGRRVPTRTVPLPRRD